MSLFKDKIEQLIEAVEEAKCHQEEVEECGDLEERMEAALAVEEAELALSRERLRDPQDDPSEPIFP